MPYIKEWRARWDRNRLLLHHADSSRRSTGRTRASKKAFRWDTGSLTSLYRNFFRMESAFEVHITRCSRTSEQRVEALKRDMRYIVGQAYEISNYLNIYELNLNKICAQISLLFLLVCRGQVRWEGYDPSRYRVRPSSEGIWESCRAKRTPECVWGQERWTDSRRYNLPQIPVATASRVAWGSRVPYRFPPYLLLQSWRLSARMHSIAGCWQSKARSSTPWYPSILSPSSWHR